MTTDLSPSGIQRLLEICDKASPAPWVAGYSGHMIFTPDPESAVEGGQLLIGDFDDARDVAAAVAARTALPDALREIERLKRPEMWCRSCGAVTKDDDCDCTRGDHPELQNLRPYIEEFGRQAREALVALRSALQDIIDRSNNSELGTGKVPDMRDIAVKALADAGIPMSASRDRIVAAAILTEAGAIMSVERPGRHHTILHALPNAPWKHKAEQGFLTDAGTFVGRMQALEIARLSGQIQRETAPQHGLFSEDVW